MEFFAILVNIPCPTFEEAKKIATDLLEKNLCGTIKISKDVHLMYKLDEKVEGEDIYLLSIKTTKTNLKDIETYIFENHSWGTPCIDALPIVTDHC
jgi:uncharacterized protein involved in tolerance to divalent cations